MKKIKKFRDYEDDMAVKKKKKPALKKKIDDFEDAKWNKRVFIKKHFEEE